MAKVSLERGKTKFLLIEGMYQRTLESPRAAGHTNTEFHKDALDDKQLKEPIRDAHFIGLRSCTHLTKNVINAAEKLVAIGCLRIEADQVDLDTTVKHGIPIFNVPFSDMRFIVELVIDELLLLLRDVPEANVKTHRGVWNKPVAGPFEARDKKLSIIGYDHIGTQLDILVEPLGTYVHFYNTENELSLGNATQVQYLSDLLNMSDVASLHVPENPSTENMMGVKEVSLMKPSSLLINASHGTTVDIPALCNTLASRHLTGATIDAFPTEPATNNDPFTFPLYELDNVLLTPHIGDLIREVQENISLEVAGKLIRYSGSGSTLSAMNFLEVSLPLHGGCHLMHIHENRPGVLAAPNRTFAEQDVNTTAQYLQTSARMSYMIIDTEVDKDVAEKALQTMEVIPGTIHVHLLY